MNTKIIHLISFSTIFMAFLLILYFMYLQFWPFNVVELQKFSVLDEVVCAGDDVTIELNFQKNIDITPEIRWSLVNSDYFSLDSANRTAPPGLTIRPGLHKTIPEFVHEDLYHIEIRADYKITPFRTISYLWDSNEFLVLECED